MGTFANFKKTVAQLTGQKANYSKFKRDNQYYRDLILQALQDHGSLDHNDINQLLWEKLPDSMNENL